MFLNKIFILSMFLFLNVFSQNNQDADLLVFSYDRPIQLYAFLESMQKYILGLNQINIIYRTSCQEIKNAYEIVKKRFTNVNFHLQNEGLMDFKSLVLKNSFETSGDYIIFSVDDIIVKDFIDIKACISSLQKTNSYGFYLRLGFNITQCYMHNDEITPVPISKQISNNIFQWNFNNGSGDWKYPNTVDMTLYKKDVIKNNFLNLNFNNPSDLEAQWAQNANYNLNGLFFKESKIVNTPLNIVHDEKLNIENRHASIYSTKYLLDIFNKDLKIDINLYHNINNIAPHAAIIPKFISR